jgi:uncharacterized cupin superfamily protein
MPKIAMSSVPARKGAPYPRPFDEPCAARTRRRPGDAGGLRDFGVNLQIRLSSVGRGRSLSGPI